MSIIALSGKMQSGKNLSANIIQYLIDKKRIGYTTKDSKEDLESYLKNKHNLRCDWQQKAFADKLKDIVCLLIGCTREQLEDQEFKNTELGEEWNIPLDNSFTDIPGYEGLYQINKLGNIKSLYRVTSLNKVIEESIRSYHIGTNGYFNVTLNKNGIKKTHSVHQLMAITYLNHIPNGYKSVINHIDTNKFNNKIDNIEIVSSRYNTQYSKNTKGVYERNNRFEIYLRIDGIKMYLGSFDDREKALEVRNKKLKEIDNFIPVRYKPKQWTPRLLLQHLGTNIGRNIIHPNIWVNSLMSEYKELFNPFSKIDSSGDYPNWIITDMRFPNEMKAVKDRDGITIRVTRNKFNISNIKEAKEYLGSFEEYKNRHGGHSIILSIANALWLENQNFHESEKALDNAIFDWEIDNNGTIDELIVKVRQTLITEKII